MHIYCENFKNDTECTHPKKDKKAKPKCAKCLTDRMASLIYNT